MVEIGNKLIATHPMDCTTNDGTGFTIAFGDSFTVDVIENSIVQLKPDGYCFYDYLEVPICNIQRGFSIGRKKAIESNVEIIHGDCFKELKNIEDKSIDLVVTDPPYFIDKFDDKWAIANESHKYKETDVIGGMPVGMKFDPKDGIRLQHFSKYLGSMLMDVMKPGAFALVFSQPRLVHRMMVGFEDAGFEIRDLYCWYYMDKAQFKAFSMDHFIDKMNLSETRKAHLKENMNYFKTAQLRPQFESLILAQKPKEGTHVDNWIEYNTGLMDLSRFNKMPTTVMQFSKDKRDKFNNHPTVKPVALIEHLIKLFSTRHQLVLDPFLGSGTTVLAAKHTLRDCIGIEKNSDYIDIANQRLANDNLLFDFA